MHDFADGVYVVADLAGGGHIGRRVTAIDGVPIESVVERVQPLIPRDNESTIRWLLPEYLVCAEVLRGLESSEGRRDLLVRRRSEATLDPTAERGMMDAPEPRSAPLPTRATRSAALPRRVSLPARAARARPVALSRLPHGQIAASVARRPDPLAARKPGFRKLVVDVRANGGGNNATYFPLIDLINERPLRGKVVLLLGRMTFSAAGNFAVDVDLATRARSSASRAGGAPNQWGDRNQIDLPLAGLTAYVAAQYVEVVAATGGTRSSPTCAWSPPRPTSSPAGIAVLAARSRSAGAPECRR